MQSKTINLQYHPFVLSFTSSSFLHDIIGVGSFEEIPRNCFDIYSFRENQLKLEYKSDYFQFPLTCCKFSPNPINDFNDFLLTGSDNVKLYEVKSTDDLKLNVNLLSKFQINDTKNPVTALDWSHNDRTHAIVASTDNSIGILDFAAETMSAKILVHDNPIFDCAFCDGHNTFVTAGCDGSLRFIDSRDLSSITVLYQAAMPLLRLAVYPADPNLIAVFGRAATGVTLVDARMPGLPAAASTHVDKEITAMGWKVLHENPKPILISTNSAGQLRMCDFSMGKTMVPNQIIYDTKKKNESMALSEKFAAVTHDNELEIIPINEAEIFYDDGSLTDQGIDIEF